MASEPPNPLHLVVLGPTASGKSAVAMELARRLGGEILSVDSMQVYRGMDIGTAKPTAAERAEVPHHLIDVVDPSEEFTTARFVELAEVVLRTVERPLIVTGGTPLYYKALFEGLFEGPAADLELRQSLEALGNDALYARLAEVDPAAATRIHRNDTRRLVRALEVYELTGRPISEHQEQWSPDSPEPPPLRHEAIWFGLNWDRELLNRRINQRTKQMMVAGWVEETAKLLETYGSLSRTAAAATGYEQIVRHLYGHQSLDETAEAIKIATRQLARRQMKWFRRWPQIRWLAGDQSPEQLADEILQHAQTVRT